VARFVATGNGGYEIALKRSDGTSTRKNGNVSRRPEDNGRADSSAKRAENGNERSSDATKRAEPGARSNRNGSAKRTEAPRHG
jgi:hypothetical protein